MEIDENKDNTVICSVSNVVVVNELRLLKRKKERKKEKLTPGRNWMCPEDLR